MCLVRDYKHEKISYWKYFMYEYWEEEGDERTKKFPLFSDGPLIMLMIMISYVLLVKVILPQIMSKRAPFELRRSMFIYNILMILINAYFFVEALICLEFGKAITRLEFPDRKDNSEFTMRMINSAFYYYLSKYIDLIETLFFVLRKKDSQITFLHLYHHTVVPTLGWLGIKINPMIPGLIIFAVLNSLIHVIMYSYYALSTLGPSLHKYLWWKKYITQMQLAQFAVLGLYGIIASPFLTGYKSIYLWIGFSQPPIFFYLFYHFYRQAYEQRRSKYL